MAGLPRLYHAADRRATVALFVAVAGTEVTLTILFATVGVFVDRTLAETGATLSGDGRAEGTADRNRLPPPP